MSAKPLPYPSWVLFMKRYPRATEIVIAYSRNIPPFGYNLCRQKPEKWQEFKFLAKFTQIALDIDTSRSWFDFESWARSTVQRAERMWISWGLLACPRMSNMRFYYTNV